MTVKNSSNATKVPKYVFLSLNTVLAVGGIVLLVFGIVLIAYIYNFIYLVPRNPRLMAILSIVFGIFACFSTSIGYIGALVKLRLVLIAYVILLIPLAGVNIWMCVSIFIAKDELFRTTTDLLRGFFMSPVFFRYFTFLEVRLRCCGAIGSNSYFDMGIPISPTCCAYPFNGNCNNSSSGTFRGCNTAMTDLFTTFGNMIGSVFGVVAGVQLAVAISAIVLIIFRSRERRDKMAEDTRTSTVEANSQ